MAPLGKLFFGKIQKDGKVENNARLASKLSESRDKKFAIMVSDVAQIHPSHFTKSDVIRMAADQKARLIGRMNIVAMMMLVFFMMLLTFFALATEMNWQNE